MKNKLLRMALAILFAGAITARADAVLDWGRSLIAKRYSINVNQVLASVAPGGEDLALMESSNLGILAGRITRPVPVSLRSIPA
jgi:hypothetical protein